jgi:hypothetical protein
LFIIKVSKFWSFTAINKHLKELVVQQQQQVSQPQSQAQQEIQQPQNIQIQ